MFISSVQRPDLDSSIILNPSVGRVFEAGSLTELDTVCIGWTGMPVNSQDLWVSLPTPTKCWGYRHAQPCTALQIPTEVENHNVLASFMSA